MSDMPLGLAARAGYAGKGVLHLLVGVLAVSLVIGGSEEDASSQGAIDALSRQPFGGALLVLVGFGLAGYAAFRFARTVAPPKGGWDGIPGWLGRLASFVRGLVYATLAVLAFRNVLGGSSGAGSETRATARLLELPGGVVLIVVIGVVVLGIGAYHLWHAWDGDPLDGCDVSTLSTARCWVYRAVSRSGFAGRALVYALVGVFLIRAALRFDPQEGVGLDGALSEVAQAPWGAPVLVLAGVGLALYAGHCWVIAAHGVVHEVE